MGFIFAYRAIYLRKSIVAKLIFLLFQLFVWHIWLLFVLPAVTDRSVTAIYVCCMCVCVCVCVCACACACMHVYVYVHAHTYTVCTCVHVRCAHTHIHRTWTHTHTHTHTNFDIHFVAQGFHRQWFLTSTLLLQEFVLHPLSSAVCQWLSQKSSRILYQQAIQHCNQDNVHDVRTVYGHVFVYVCAHACMRV